MDAKNLRNGTLGAIYSSHRRPSRFGTGLPTGLPAHRRFELTITRGRPRQDRKVRRPLSAWRRQSNPPGGVARGHIKRPYQETIFGRALQPERAFSNRRPVLSSLNPTALSENQLLPARQPSPQPCQRSRSYCRKTSAFRSNGALLTVKITAPANSNASSGRAANIAFALEFLRSCT